MNFSYSPFGKMADVCRLSCAIVLGKVILGFLQKVFSIQLEASLIPNEI